MYNNYNTIICSKCETEMDENFIFRNFRCGHIICRNCFIEYLLDRGFMIFFPAKIIDCLILGCNGFIIVGGESLIKFIGETNNEKLIKKYKASIILYEYFMKFFSLVSIAN